MKTKHYHFIGIGGIGMSALARILLKQNITVSGSDAHESYILDNLAQEGAQIKIGHAEEHIATDATVIYNSMINKENPEFAAALKHKCTMLHRSDLLREIGRGYKTLAVTGTHGKTTTSSLLAAVLLNAGMDPAYALGGLLLDGRFNGGYGKGDYFVVEADESDGSFLKYPVNGAIVTNIDNDHLDHYGSFEALREAFDKFMQNVAQEELLFWCKDNAELLTLATRGVSYGFQSHSRLLGSNLRHDGWKSVFDISFNDKTYKDVEIALAGKHQALNALAVFGMAITLGIDENSIRETFKSFKGIARRCERKLDTYSLLLLDDYAHHPTEIKTTLQGVRRAVKERRLIAVFQPHRYSRVASCFNQFNDVFNEADELIITDIYSASEKPLPGISTMALVDEIKNNAQIPVRYVPKEKLKDELIASLRPFDVMITLNAGDINKICGEVAHHFETHKPTKYKCCVAFGGKSSEHDIALLSAKYIISSLSDEFYQLSYCGVSKDGHWVASDAPLKTIEAKEDSYLPQESLAVLAGSDIIFPVFHGPFGEDGMLQGLFEVLSKAYVGCDHRSAGLCMDKALTKRIAMTYGIKTAKFLDFSYAKWQEDKAAIVSEIMESLKFPVFVKPVHLGSSIGISKVERARDLSAAIEHALENDTYVLVEEGLKGREIEFAILGNDYLTIPEPGEILTEGSVYDYDAKYGPESMTAAVPADLKADLVNEGRKLAEIVYKALGCTGLARVDFFLDSEGTYWLNEVNPFPGFTSISVYPKAMQYGGIAAAHLIDKLIILGLQRKRFQDRHLKPTPSKKR